MGAINPTLAAAPPRAGDPARDAIEFTGTADVTLATHSRAIYIGGAGTLKVDMLGHDGTTGATVTFAGCLVGTILPICITKIYDTGTTASGVVLL
jgi:hypothetical protein